MKQGTQDTNDQNNHQVPWNKGKLIGQKSPLKERDLGNSYSFADG